MDVIFYIHDKNSFFANVSDECMESLSTRTPIHYNGNEALFIARATSQAYLIDGIERLGEVVNGAAAFDSENKKGTYERVREPRHFTVDIDGADIVFTRPYLIGVIA